MTDLVKILSTVNGSSFVSIDTLIKVTLKGGRKNDQQGRVTKAMTGASVMVFQNKAINGYEAMVHRRLIAEGKDPASFELGERAWGERVPDLPIVKHNTKDGAIKYYLEVIFLRPGEVTYLLDGLPIDKSKIIGLDEKEEGKQGSLENKVIIRSFCTDSLVRVRIDHAEHRAPFDCPGI